MLPETDRDAQFEFMFVGTGTSSAVPILPCITDPEQRCKTCLSSAEEDTRGNTSAVVQAKGSDGGFKTILIDCGKTFYRDSLKHFPKRGLRKIDGLLLTHGHADAMYGLDDLRVCDNPLFGVSTLTSPFTGLDHAFDTGLYRRLHQPGYIQYSKHRLSLQWVTDIIKECTDVRITVVDSSKGGQSLTLSEFI